MMMSMSLWRFAPRIMRPCTRFPRVQLVAPGRCTSLEAAARTPFGTGFARLSKSRFVSRRFGAEVW